MTPYRWMDLEVPQKLTIIESLFYSGKPLYKFVGHTILIAKEVMQAFIKLLTTLLIVSVVFGLLMALIIGLDAGLSYIWTHFVTTLVLVGGILGFKIFGDFIKERIKNNQYRISIQIQNKLGTKEIK